ncbi:MAG: right-handed parallel beta-helix repeat-containing protein [Methylotenera sp.]|nr:right-handed parallel beta-helix repeat-containing protein [Methylotenera sp.]
MRSILFSLIILAFSFLFTGCAGDDGSYNSGADETSEVKAAEEVCAVQLVSIQHEIDSAVDGDVIIIEPGIYYENIDFKGKAIMLKSIDPGNAEIVKNTVIDGGGLGSTVVFQSGEGVDTVLEGFTITGGNGYKVTSGSEQNNRGLHYYGWGGGILVANESSPTIANNIIDNNDGRTGGGIAVIRASSPHIFNNVIIGNRAEVGGGIYLSWSNALVEGNYIAKNSAAKGDGNTGRGGGIAIEDDAEPIIRGNILESNEAIEEGGGVFAEGVKYYLEENSFIENVVLNGSGGAVFIGMWSSGQIIDNLFIYNSATYDGGGVSVFDSDVELLGNEFTGNTGRNGGAIDISISRAKIMGNSFLQNRAEGLGGAIVISANEAEVSDNVFSANRAGTSGGAIWSYRSGEYSAYDPNTDKSYSLEAVIIIGDSNVFSDNEPENVYFEER